MWAIPIGLIGFLIGNWSKMFPKKMPNYLKLVKGSDIFPILNKELPDGIVPTMTEDEYKVYEDSEIDRVIKTFKELNRQYSVDYDCDNFAFEFYVVAERMLPRCLVGVEFVNRSIAPHALNFWIDKNMVKWFIEPQTGQITNSGVHKPYWSLI